MTDAQLLVFSPHCALRFDGGRLVIEGHAGTPPLITDQVFLGGWLMRFAEATDVHAALATIDDAQARDFVSRAIAFLCSNGCLVEPQAQVQESTAEDAHAASRAHLASLSRGVYELGCDVAGFGPHAEAVLRAGGGAGLQARLRALDAGVAALRAELARHRGAYLDGQLQVLEAARGATADTAIDLHLGCGPCPLDGWVNVDIYPAPLAMNVLWGLPFADGSVRRVFMSHLLEHLFYPHDADAFLREILRVLAPGARARFVVPDIGACIAAYQRGDAAFFDARVEHWGEGDGRATPLEGFLSYAGAGPDPAWLFEAHKFGFDFDTLERALERAGFSGIERSGYLGSADAGLRLDDRSEVASASHEGEHYSLFVEAVKPLA